MQHERVRTRMVGAALVGALATPTVTTAQSAPQYKIIDIGPIKLGSAPFSPNGLEGTFGINGLGEVAGTYHDGSDRRAFLWLPVGNYNLSQGFIDFAPSEGPSAAYDINDDGLVAGQIGDPDTDGLATVWELDEVPITETTFDPFEDGDISVAHAVTAGVASVATVVGGAQRDGLCGPTQSAPAFRAFSADADGGTPVELSGSSAPVRDMAFDVADPSNPFIVGEGGDCDDKSNCQVANEGFVWSGTTRTAVERLDENAGAAAHWAPTWPARSWAGPAMSPTHAACAPRSGNRPPTTSLDSAS